MSFLSKLNAIVTKKDRRIVESSEYQYSANEWNTLRNSILGYYANYQDVDGVDLNSEISAISTGTILIDKECALSADLDLTAKPDLNFEFINGGKITGNYTITFTGNKWNDVKFQIFGDSVELLGYCGQEFIRPEWFGSFSGGYVDDVPIQKAIDFTALNSLAAKTVELKFLPRKYYLGNTIIIGSLNIAQSKFNFLEFNFIGSAMGYDRGTHFIVNFKDKPAIISQATRSMIVKNIHISGLMSDTLRAENMQDESIYIDSTCQDTRYTPYCGWIVDHFSANGAIAGYTYDGLEDWYLGAQGSSGTFISNCKIQGFIIGIGLSISYTLQLNDSVVIRDCNLARNKVCVAEGQDQIRGCYIYNLHANYVEVVVDQLRYGDIKASNVVLYGGVFTTVRWMFLLSNRRGVNVINDAYGELIGSLGYVANTSLSKGFPVSFNNCNFKLDDTLENGNIRSDYHFYCEQALVTFDKCFLGYYRSSHQYLYFINTYSDVKVANCITDAIIQRGSVANEIEFENTVTTQQSGIQSGGMYGFAMPDAMELTVNGDGTGTIALYDGAVVDDIVFMGKTVNIKKYDYTLQSETLIYMIGKIDSIDTVINVVGLPESIIAGTHGIYYYLAIADNIRSICNIISATLTISEITNMTDWVVGDWVFLNQDIDTKPRRVIALDSEAKTMSLSGSVLGQDYTSIELYKQKIFTPETTESNSTPIAGTYFKGDYVTNTITEDVSGEYIRGWKCVKSGSFDNENHADPVFIIETY